MRYLPLVLFALVFASACAGIPGLGGAQQTKIVSKDLLKINVLDVFPQSELIFDEVFSVRMEVENVGQAAASFDTKDVNATGVLTDYCQDFFKITSFDSFPRKPVGNRVILNPGEATTLQWTMRAPDRSKSQGISVPCTFRFNIKYEADARTTAYIYFINPIEAQQRLYTQKELKLTGDNIASFGPVAVNLETPQQPVATSATADKPTTFTIFFNMKNLGSGDANISSMEFAVWAAEKGFNVKPDCLQNFKKKGNGLEVDTAKPENKDLLTVFAQGSSRLGCSMEAPPTPILTPYRFEALAKYSYNLGKELKINVREQRAAGGVAAPGGVQLPGF